MYCLDRLKESVELCCNLCVGFPVVEEVTGLQLAASHHGAVKKKYGTEKNNRPADPSGRRDHAISKSLRAQKLWLRNGANLSQIVVGPLERSLLER